MVWMASGNFSGIFAHFLLPDLPGTTISYLPMYLASGTWDQTGDNSPWQQLSTEKSMSPATSLWVWSRACAVHVLVYTTANKTTKLGCRFDYSKLVLHLTLIRLPDFAQLKPSAARERDAKRICFWQSLAALRDKAVSVLKWSQSKGPRGSATARH